MLGRFLHLNKIKTKRLQITWANILFTLENREHNKCLHFPEIWVVIIILLIIKIIIIIIIIIIAVVIVVVIIII